MQFDALIEARMLRRYKRFLADVEVEGELRTVHCANPGSMRGLIHEGARCWISDSHNPKRKLRFSLELVETPGATVLVNTSRTNAIAEEALRAGIVDIGGRIETLRSEVKRGDSRLDFLATVEGRALWIEVKQVTLADPPLARFPDSQTKRGLKHLEELESIVQQGDEEAALLLVVTRDDCDRFEPARDIDPAWSDAFTRVSAAGVRILVYACAVDPVGNPSGVHITHALPWRA